MTINKNYVKGKKRTKEDDRSLISILNLKITHLLLLRITKYLGVCIKEKVIKLLLEFRDTTWLGGWERGTWTPELQYELSPLLALR